MMIITTNSNIKAQEFIPAYFFKDTSYFNYYREKPIMKHFYAASICKKIDILDSLINAQFITFKFTDTMLVWKEHYRIMYYLAIDSNGYQHFIESGNELNGLSDYTYFHWIMKMPDDIKNAYEKNNYYTNVKPIYDSNGKYLYDIYVKMNACWFCVELMSDEIEKSLDDTIHIFDIIYTEMMNYPYFCNEPISREKIKEIKKQLNCE